jgi:hypothetical protein
MTSASMRHEREPGTIVDAAALRARLGHVYWIGGGSGAGKSTIARRVAARHGLRLYATDDVMADHARRCAPGDCPLLAAFAAMDMDQNTDDDVPAQKSAHRAGRPQRAGGGGQHVGSAESAVNRSAGAADRRERARVPERDSSVGARAAARFRRLVVRAFLRMTGISCKHCYADSM